MENIFLSLDQIQSELTLCKSILDAAPAIMYINEMQKPNDYQTCRNVWMNQRGLDFVGYTQEEITAKGYSFFDEFIHPDDMEALPESVKTVYSSKDEIIFVGMYRVKNKHQELYSWLYGQYLVLNTFPDGSMRQMLVVAQDITEKMHSENQLVSALKEINHLKNGIKISGLSIREKEILHLISQGKSDTEIAKKLYLSIKTIKKHHNNILHKLGMHKTTEMVSFVKECGY